MKTSSLLIAAMFLALTSAFAQKEKDIPSSSWDHEVAVSRVSVSAGDSSLNAFAVPLFDARKTNVEKLFRHRFEQRSQKIDKERSGFMVYGLSFPSLGSASSNAYVNFENNGDDVMMQVAFLQQNGDLPADEVVKRQKFMLDMGVDMNRDVVQVELDEATKTLEDLREDMEDIIDDQQGLRQDAQKQTGKIVDANRDMSNSQKRLIREQEKLEKMQLEYPVPTAKEMKKILRQKKTIEKVEKDIVKAMNNQEKFTKRTSKIQKSDIPDMADDREDLADKITIQEKIVAALTRKLGQVK